MTLVTLLRGRKTQKAFEVTLGDLQKLVNDYPISIGDDDSIALESKNDDEIVGYVASTSDKIFNLEKLDECEVIDAWFINLNYAKSNYARIDDNTKDLTFGEALVLLKEGYKLARAGWNGKGLFIFLVPGSKFKVNRPPLLGIYDEGTEIEYRPHIDIKTADGSIATWSPSGSDALAEDWEIVK